jgi:hypothetical protein
LIGVHYSNKQPAVPVRQLLVDVETTDGLPVC